MRKLASVAFATAFAVSCADAQAPGTTGVLSDVPSEELFGSDGSPVGGDAGPTDTGAIDTGAADATPAVSDVVDAVGDGGSSADVDTAEPPDAELPDSAEGEILDGAPAADGDGGATADADTPSADAKLCTPGTQTCQGVKLATCGPKGDGYIITPCFPGMSCVLGKGCTAVANNLIIAFDTSGSMSEVVKKADGSMKCSGSDFKSWPGCEYDPVKFPGGCTRMGVSKAVFQLALAKIDEQVTRMALFRFPQKSKTSSPSCNSGYFSGQSALTGDAGAQTVDASASWYWSNLSQTLCVPFPAQAVPVKPAILLWMDGKEAIDVSPPDPELRSDGGTPIGKTLFYIGEYLRHKVIVDGLPCTDTASCGNVNYVCEKGKCVDLSRSCRETVVVLFTDGGESNSNSYFAPWVQAKRLSTGLSCQTDADCVGGAVCATYRQCMKGSTPLYRECTTDAECKDPLDDKLSGICDTKVYQQCVPKDQVTGSFCVDGGAPCLSKATPGQPTWCATSKSAQEQEDRCVRDPRIGLTAQASPPAANVLRSPDGKAFGVRVHIVDISGSTSKTDVKNSMSLSLSGNGKLLGADASDPEKFLGALEQAFDIKNKKICGVTL